MTIKAGDTFPPLVATLTDSTGAVDLTTAESVVLRMVDCAGVNVIDDAACTVTNAVLGVVEYQWAALDTATAGLYHAEFRVTFAGGSIASFPNDSYIIVEILPALAEAPAI